MTTPRGAEIATLYQYFYAALEAVASNRRLAGNKKPAQAYSHGGFLSALAAFL